MKEQNVIRGLIETHLKKGKSYLSLTARPDDSVALINVNDTSEESVIKVYNTIHEKYRNHIIGYKESYYEDGRFSHWTLIFEAEFQKLFDDEKAAYYQDKASWIARFGCD